MAVTTGQVRVVFEGDNSDLERAVRSSQTALGRLDTTTKSYSSTVRKADDDTSRFDRNTSRLGSTLRGAAGAAAGAAAAYIGISQITSAIAATQDLAKATISLHENLGLSVKEASQWGAVASARGVDSVKLGMAFKTLSTQVVAARDGSESAAAGFEKLGLSQRDVQKGSKDTTFLVGKVADGLNDLSGGADKAAISGKLFGRGWQTVQPILRDGSKEMQRQLDLANKYGASFGGKSLESVKDLIAAQRELKLAQLGLQVQFTEHIAPALIDVGLAFAKFIHQVDKGKGTGGDVAKVFNVIADGIHVAYVTIKWTVNAIADAFRFMARGVKESVKNVKDAFWAIVNPVKGAVRAIGRAVGGLGKGIGKVAGGIGKAFRGVAGVIRDIVHFIVSAVNKAIAALGDLKDAVPDVNLPDLPQAGDDNFFPDQSLLGGLLGLARGGHVPGFGTGDKVPALLEPKEFVVNSRATEKHRPLLEAINRGTPRFGAAEPHAFVLPVAVGRQTGGLARLRHHERRMTHQLHRLERGPSPDKHRSARTESLRATLAQLGDAITEQTHEIREFKRVARAQQGKLEGIVAATVSGFIGGRVGLANQAAGVPGSFGRL